MKTVYLHIGMGKTGTTSIQRFLAIHSQTLMRGGVHYILAEGGLSGDGHQGLAKSCITDVPDYMEIGGDVDRECESILAEMKSVQKPTILLSSENFLLADPQEVFRFFADAFSDLSIKIILFVRSQDELVESEYNQLVKVRTENRTLAEYAESQFEGDFMAIATRWGSIFGDENLICRVYDASRQDAISDILSCLPLESKVRGELLSEDNMLENKALDAERLAGKLINNKAQSTNTSSNSPDMCNEQFVGKIPAVLMSSQDARKFRQKFSLSNYQFSERYLGYKTSDLMGRRFTDQDRDRYYVQWQELTKISSRY